MNGWEHPSALTPRMLDKMAAGFGVPDRTSKFMSLCESPIEEILAGRLIGAGFALAFGLCTAEAVAAAFQQRRRLLFAQYPIPPYRVDFLVVDPATKPLVVECDGHQFHQGDPSTWERDHQRDLAMKAAGYRVVRFSGWRIHNECDEVLSIIHQGLRGEFDD